MLYRTANGRLVDEETLNNLPTYQIEQLGIHAADEYWEFN